MSTAPSARFPVMPGMPHLQGVREALPGLIEEAGTKPEATKKTVETADLEGQFLDGKLGGKPLPTKAVHA